MRRRAWDADVLDHQAAARVSQWRREYVDKLTGDFFNPSRRVRLRWEVVTCQLACNGAREPARTSTLTRHLRTRCWNQRSHKSHVRDWLWSKSTVEHWAARVARIEGFLLQQSRMKPTEEEEPRGGRTTTKSVPMKLEKPTGPAVQHGSSSGSGVQRNDAISIGVMRLADEKLPVPDVEMGAEELCAAQIKGAKTIMGLQICVLEAQDDVYFETPGTPTNPAETCNENASEEDIVSPDVTGELNRLKTLG